MTAELWQEVERHLLSLLTLTPREREAYLERVSRGDLVLRGLLESMLASEGEMGDFLEVPIVSRVFGQPPAELAELREGQRIGPYRVLREIGRGGMSVVCLALREDLHRQVAIKVIKRGMDSAEILQRFLTERQILANLNHPSIAQLYDGGTIADGLPYFVMEYVEGEPIDRYCDRRRLPIAERVELFRRVSAAVHYAHQNLVVHRDLKPSNILVTADGVPKLLDFGIAKVLDPYGPEGLKATAPWLRLMTPNYASPEQINGQAITTASDVYSLAVLLYELLTGHLPYRFETGSPQELERVLGKIRPSKPSVVVARSREDSNTAPAPDPQTLARARSTQPAKLARLLRGDLDTIVLTALQAEPQRRYGSVEQLSEDLRRSQAGLAISAREDSFWYLASTFLRRNKLPAAMALAAALLVVAFGVVALLQAIRVDRAHQRAEQVSEFLVALFEASADDSARGDAITARELLERGAARVERDLESQPDVQATLLDTIGRAFSHLHFFDRAIPLFEEALRIRRRELGPRAPLVATSLGNLAVAQWKAAQHEASQRSFEAALALRRQLDGESSPEIAEILYGLGHLRVAQGDLEGAARTARQAAGMQRKLLGGDHGSTARSEALLARCLRDLGEHREAEELYRAAIRRLREALGDHPDLAEALNGFGFLLAERGDLEAAAAPTEQGLAMRRRLFGENHPAYAESLNVQAFLCRERGDYEAAIPLLRQSLDVLRQRYGEAHPAVAREQFNLAESLAEMGQPREAEALFRQTLALASRLVGEAHPRVAILRVNLATVLHAQGRVDEAEGHLREAMAALRASVGEQHLFLAQARLAFASLLADRGQFEAAEAMLRQALPIVERALGEGHWRTAQARSELAGSLVGQGKLAEAETLLRASYPQLVARRGSDTGVARRACGHVVRLYQALEKPEQAVEWCQAPPSPASSIRPRPAG